MHLKQLVTKLVSKEPLIVLLVDWAIDGLLISGFPNRR